MPRTWRLDGGAGVELRRCKKPWSPGCLWDRICPSAEAQAGTSCGEGEQNDRAVALKVDMELPVTAAAAMLDFITPGCALGVMASTSTHWCGAARQPELWWRVCTRSAAPLVRPGAVSKTIGEDGSFDSFAWRALAQASRGALVAAWEAALPPCLLLRCLPVPREASNHNGRWVALTTLKGVDQTHQQQPSGADTPGDTTVPTKLGVSSPFLACTSLFPLSGGFVLSFEEERLANKMINACSESVDRLWVALSAPAGGPSAIRMVLAWQGCPKGATVAAELSIQVQADRAARLRLDDCGDAAALAGLRGAISRGSLDAVVHVAPIHDAEGYPGGSGWIPWKPKCPSITLL